MEGDISTCASGFLDGAKSSLPSPPSPYQGLCFGCPSMTAGRRGVGQVGVKWPKIAGLSVRPFTSDSAVADILSRSNQEHHQQKTTRAEVP
jgi:hypothetical protein